METLVSLAVLSILLILAVQFISHTSNAWKSVSSKVEQFRESRLALESMTQKLSQATLDSYGGYEYANVALPNGVQMAMPVNFGRRSELRFICGPASDLTGNTSCPTEAIFFTAPLGITNSASYTRLRGLLNICGYFVEWSNRDVDRPAILPGTAPYRFRLMQFIEPAEKMALYSKTSTVAPQFAYRPAPGWQKDSLTTSNTSARTVANNVVALLALAKRNPEDPLDKTMPGFLYDSENTSTDPALTPRNRLPGMITVILYTIDEASAQGLSQTSTMPDLYQISGTPLFKDPAKLYPSGSDIGDLSRFEQNLTNFKLKYHRHEATLRLMPEPWSNN